MTVSNRPERPEWVDVDEAYQNWCNLIQAANDLQNKIQLLHDEALPAFQHWFKLVQSMTECKNNQDILNVGMQLVLDDQYPVITDAFNVYAFLQTKITQMVNEHKIVCQYAHKAYETIESCAQWYDELRGLSREELLNLLKK